MTETATKTPDSEAWDKIGAYLKRSNVRLLSDEEKNRLQADWEDVTRLEGQLDDALLIGLMGGTGVGKSTFINALAGDKVSRSGDRRPTTDRVVVYRHVDTELPDDVPTADLSQPQVLHRNEDLTKVALFDFPDFDSAERKHTHILQKYLEYLDVLLIVVDDVKYADRRLYELLSTLNHAEENLYVLFNKVDRLGKRYGDDADRVVAEVLDDLKTKLVDNAKLNLNSDQLFPISAGSVLEARMAGDSCEHFEAFHKVEKLLSGYQEDKHRRQAKEQNIDSRKVLLTSRISQTALGNENKSILSETRELVEEWKDDLNQSLRAIPPELLVERERRTMRKARMRRSGPKWGLPFSLIFTLFGEMPWSRTTEASLEPQELGARIFQHYRGFFESIKNLQSRFQSEFAGSQIAAAASLKPSEVESPEQWAAAMAGKVQGEIQQKEAPPSRWARWLCHVPGLGVLIMAIWGKVYPMIDMNDGKGFFSSFASAFLAAINPMYILGVVLSVVLAYFLAGVVLWFREIQILDGHIATAEHSIREDVDAKGQIVLQNLEDNVGALATEFAEVEGLVE